MSNARDIAYEMTRRVNEEGSYIGLLLRYSMESGRLDARDRGLVSELLYGLQRHRRRLDYVIESFSRRSLEDIDPAVLDILRLGMYQLSDMRVPQHAAVNETVDLAKRHIGRGAASFVNAVMRRASEDLRHVDMPDREELYPFLGTVYSYPRWLVEYLVGLLGPEEAESLCIAQNEVPGLTLRANTSRIDPSVLLGELESCGGKGRRCTYAEEGLGDISLPYDCLLDLLDRGLCVVQGESSMLVARAVKPEPGEVVLDACAAPGGKTTHLATLGGSACRVIAVDSNARRLQALRKTVRRLGLGNIEIREGDSSQLSGFMHEAADRVLVDAPCSGLGTLRRNPELKWRRLPGDLAELGSLQLSLLRGCAASVREGGIMVYSVCTYSREETEDVVDAFLESNHDFVMEKIGPYLPDAMADAVAPGGYVQIWPHRHNMEGMFIARMRKT